MNLTNDRATAIRLAEQVPLYRQQNPPPISKG